MFIIQKINNTITLNGIQFPNNLLYNINNKQDKVECTIDNNKIIYKHPDYTITIHPFQYMINFTNDKGCNTSFHFNMNLKIITSEDILEIIKFIDLLENMNLNNFKTIVINHTTFINLLNNIPKIIGNPTYTFMHMDTNHKTLCMEIQEYEVIITEYFILCHKDHQYFLLGEGKFYYSITPHTSLQAIIRIFKENYKKIKNDKTIYGILHYILKSLYHLFGNCVLYCRNHNIFMESLLHNNNEIYYIIPQYKDAKYYISFYINHIGYLNKYILFKDTENNIEVFIYNNEQIIHVKNQNINNKFINNNNKDININADDIIELIINFQKFKKAQENKI